MKKFFITVLATVLAWSGSISAQIKINPDMEIGQIKPMNAVNNGPRMEQSDGSQTMVSSLAYFKAANMGFSRNHDASGCDYFGGFHIVDMSQLFPDFSKNPEKPESYDFTLTDEYVKYILSTGMEVFFRLGQSIEQYAKKYDVWPPKDFKKWAVIAEHVIRHYNEGWADGFRFNIRYWEIWNEPDLDWNTGKWSTMPRTWGGSPEQFWDFYETVAKHLKKKFPELKIGGPAMSGSDINDPNVPKWFELFISEMASRKVPLDFFSWHRYDYVPERFADQARQVRAILDKYGYTRAESNLNEWTYMKSWTEDFSYSMETIASVKGSAFFCAVMQECQDAPLDMLMYYDARPNTNFNGIINFRTNTPLPGYWAYYAWGKLRSLGTRIAASSSDPEVRVTAAKGSEGSLALLVSRYCQDDNVTSSKRIRVKLESGRFSGKVRCHIMDKYNFYTEYPVALQEDGTLLLQLYPHSFVFVEE